MAKEGALTHRQWGHTLVQLPQKWLQPFLKRLDLPYDLTISLLDACPKDAISNHKDSHCSSVFIIGVSAIAQFWNHPRCPSTDQKMMQMLCVYTIDLHSIIRKNEILKGVKMQMELENTLKGANQANKRWCHMFFHMFLIFAHACLWDSEFV